MNVICHKHKLAAITQKITKGTTPTTLKRPFTDSGINFIKIESIDSSGAFLPDKFAHIDEQTHQVLSRSILEEGDVLFSIAGAIGRSALVGNSILPANTNQAIAIIRPNQDIVSPKYLFYLTKTAEFQGRASGRIVQTAQANVNLTQLGNVIVSVPPLDTQNRIADTLSTYDDLIENNRQRIALLEQAARLLYREWFIHLRFPGHGHVRIADGVPEGWEKKQVKFAIKTLAHKKKVPKAAYQTSGRIPCVDQSQEFIGGYTDDEDSAIEEDKPIIVFGDHTRILKFVNFTFAAGADGTQLLMSADENITQEYLYFALDATNLSNYFYARHLKFLKDQYIIVPPKSLHDQFVEFAQGTTQLIKVLRNTILKFTEARDLLLPRLMNGEIAV